MMRHMAVFCFGMPLANIFKAVTLTPAKAIGYEVTIGVLEVGREADITILEVTDWAEVAEDSVENKRTLEKIMKTKTVWRNGIMKKMI